MILPRGGPPKVSELVRKDPIGKYYGLLCVTAPPLTLEATPPPSPDTHQRLDEFSHEAQTYLRLIFNKHFPNYMKAPGCIECDIIFREEQ